MQDAINKLKNFLVETRHVAIAFSGGMDSSFLALMAKKYIPESYVALLVNSEFMSRSEINIAQATAERFDLNLQEIKIDVLSNSTVVCNSDKRCYHCKKAIFSLLLEKAGNAVLCDGSVIDDDDDYRPGKQALAELHVRSPLKECGFSKTMVAEALRNLGAPELIRPAQSCLATRIVTNQKITAEKLKQIEQGEIMLRKAGLDYFRLRHHGEIARIEVANSELHDALDKVASISEDLKNLGFKHIALDVDGYQKGSMNRNNG
jgi:uncharacterized protein